MHVSMKVKRIDDLALILEEDIRIILGKIEEARANHNSEKEKMYVIKVAVRKELNIGDIVTSLRHMQFTIPNIEPMFTGFELEYWGIEVMWKT